MASLGELKPTGRTGIDAIPTWVDPDTPETRAFRVLVAAIEGSPQPTHRLAITSAEAQDGKTTVAANLAIAFAQTGKKTLLIDADLRQAGLTSLLELAGPRDCRACLANSVRSPKVRQTI